MPDYYRGLENLTPARPDAEGKETPVVLNIVSLGVKELVEDVNQALRKSIVNFCLFIIRKLTKEEEAK